MPVDSVAVTGAAGHVGSNLCVALREAGQSVRAIDLRAPVRAVEHGAHWVRADVRDEPALTAALADCEIVYHTAAVISVVGGLRGLVRSVNVDGVRAVARAALAAGARRVVHCSSVHAFDLAAAVGRAVDETSPRSVRSQLPVYDRSKASGEAELRRVVEEGLDAVVVNPTGIIGPVDETPSRMGAVLAALWTGRMPALVEGGFDWVDVRDVVSALRSAAERGRTGENYLIGGHHRSIVELARAAADVSGSPVTSRVVPAWVTRFVGPAADVIARRTGTALAPTREAMHALASFPTVDSTKAARELLHQPRPFEATLHDLHTAFTRTGRVPLSSGRSPGRQRAAP